MGFPRLKSSSMLRYAMYALFLGMAATVCAESVLGKDLSLLTPEEIEENLQVRDGTLSPGTHE